MNAELPNPFLFQDGRKVQSPEEWPKRREQIRDLVIDLEYGGMPPNPEVSEHEELHRSKTKRFGDAQSISYRLFAGPDDRFSFCMSVMVPAGEGPFPVVLTGDACWRYVSDQVLQEVLSRGNILASFNRVELAPDMYHSKRDSGLYRVYPDMAFGALSAWAWGYHRCVDTLTKLDFVDPARIAIVGHSRGGKTVLLAGATDERIALTCANDSGAGGAGCFRWEGEGSEKLSDLIRTFPYWFGPQLKEYVGRETKLPFDQHFLKALVAPRCLLTVEALGDLWANPTGTWQTHAAAREVYRFLGVEDRIGISYREGPHRHSYEDWITFLDFVDLQFRGAKQDCRFDLNPFQDLPASFSWRARS